jgi:hypothetical protein
VLTPDNQYDVFPMLVVGDASFTTIGFQTDGKTVKFKITTKMPGEKTADRNDPYELLPVSWTVSPNPCRRHDSTVAPAAWAAPINAARRAA